MIVIEVTGLTINLPTTIDEVTPEQRADFAAQFGYELARKLIAIRGMLPGFEQDMEEMSWKIEAAACRFAFFSGIPLQQLKDTPGMVGSIGDVTLFDLPELVENLMKPAVLSEYYSLS